MKFQLIYLTLLVSFMGCSTPMNGGQHTVVCLNKMMICYKEAEQLCPDGYLVNNRVRPYYEGQDTRYTLKITCRQGRSYY